MTTTNGWCPASNNVATEHIDYHIRPQTGALELEHIVHQRSETSLDVLLDGAAPQPQASLLPQPQRYLMFFSL